MKQTRQKELTEFFGELVAEVSAILSDREINEETIWMLSRKLHDVWRGAVKRLYEEESGETRQSGECHPAFKELLRLINSEMKATD